MPRYGKAYTLISRACESAYTLIELLVGLTIVGLLFGFGYANFRDFSRRQHLYGVAKLVNGDLRLAQAKASSGDKPSDAKCSGSNTLSAYSFSPVGNSGYQITAECLGGSVLDKDVTLPTDVQISSSLSPISFKVLGNGTNIPVGTDAVITLSLVGSTTVTTVTVTAGGEVK